MAKYFAIMCGFGLLALTACSKLTANSADDLSAAPSLLTKTGDANVISAVDTLVPANAVNAKSFGVVGDGSTDDTENLQKLINSQTVILLPAGTYIINKTLNLRSNVKLFGAAGATISSGTNMSGTLLTNGRFMFLNHADNCLVYNITFKPSTQAFSFSTWSNACIFAENSKNTSILYNTFNFNLKYGKTGMEAVWFTGAGTTNSLIKGNKMYTVGIEYAEDGASSSLVANNYVKNSHGVSINGHGNSDTYCSNNTIINNVVEYAGYIGIEDWGNTTGTIIKYNKVSHTGQDPSQGKDAMGISCVGQNPQIVKNEITDAFLYYIEIAGGSYHLIDSNIINDNNLATGIIVNYTAKSDKSLTTDVNDRIVISNNQINNCATGVSYYGIANINTDLRSNTIKNAKAMGVSIDSDALLITANITNNSVLFTEPATQTRHAFQTYTRLAPNDAKQNVVYTNNTIEYSAATKGSVTDYGFFVTMNNTTITNNIIKALGANVYAVSNNSGKILSLNLTKNTFTGVKNDLSAFNLLANTDNTITTK